MAAAASCGAAVATWRDGGTPQGRHWTRGGFPAFRRKSAAVSNRRLLGRDAKLQAATRLQAERLGQHGRRASRWASQPCQVSCSDDWDGGAADDQSSSACSDDWDSGATNNHSSSDSWHSATVDDHYVRHSASGCWSSTPAEDSTFPTDTRHVAGEESAMPSVSHRTADASGNLEFSRGPESQPSDSNRESDPDSAEHNSAFHSSDSTHSSSTSADDRLHQAFEPQEPFASGASFDADTRAEQSRMRAWEESEEEQLFAMLSEATDRTANFDVRAQRAGPGGSASTYFETNVVPRSGVEVGSSSAGGSRAEQIEERPQPPYWLMTLLASVGAAETLYLTVEKVLGGSVACPVEGSCSGVLDSPWGTLLGFPLSFFGFLAYSSAAYLAQSAGRSSGQGAAKWLLLATTAAMAATSGYLVYILNTKLNGLPCVYCYGSALLSAALLTLAFRGFTGAEAKQALAPAGAMAVATVLGLSLAYGDAKGTVIDFPYVEPRVLTASSSPAIALAKHLNAVGAKMYGAFWCSHCLGQKQAFGQEAMRYVNYVECYPEGYHTGIQMAPACKAANLEGFPAWEVNGQMLSGEQDLEKLAEVAGFDLKDPPAK